MAIIVIAAVAVSLGALAYFRRRRLGVLGFGLFAGMVFAGMFHDAVADFLQSAGVVTGPFSPGTLADVLLVAALPILMMINGPRYPKRSQAKVGAIGFALAAAAALTDPILAVMAPSDIAAAGYLDPVRSARDMILLAIATLAMADILLVKPPPPDDSSHGKSKKKR